MFDVPGLLSLKTPSLISLEQLAEKHAGGGRWRCDGNVIEMCWECAGNVIEMYVMGMRLKCDGNVMGM